MWFDNETDRDFLNFESIADTIAELIQRAEGEPVSIGVSGAWGVGKSSMIRMTKAALEARSEGDDAKQYVYVEFNAWLYQGYDDARAALLDVISTRLSKEAEARKSGLEKAADFARRVKWLRLAKLLALPAAAVALGLPPIGLLGEIGGVVDRLSDGDVSGDDLEAVGGTAERVGSAVGLPLLAERKESPPQEIQALRDTFEQLLEELGIVLVVLIDDLDRCLPPTAVSTLEAIRLLLFLERTAFVVAADDAMIKHAVSQHFAGLDDANLVGNYFDKLIQVPIRVPALGIHEIRAYMMMLFVDDSDLEQADKDTVRSAVATQLRASWKGARVDRRSIEECGVTVPASLAVRLDAAESLAHIMATSPKIAGNPRLIKRFLNAVALRRTMASAQGIDADEAVLAKLLLFERIATPALFHELASSCASDPEGQPRFLSEWEASIKKGEEPSLSEAWAEEHVREWLALSPPLSGLDLRGALYVGREQAPLVTDVDRLGTAAIEVLTALLEQPAEAAALKQQVASVPSVELEVIMNRLLTRARQETAWGAPDMLTACVVVADADAAVAGLLARFLMDRPPSQLQASIVPSISGKPWAKQVFAHWKGLTGVAKPVLTAIEQETGNGNVSK